MKKRKWLIIGIGLLVLVMMLSTLTGCARKSEGREPEATEAVAQATSAGVVNTPPPGETVVSAVSPGQTAGPTLVPTAVVLPGQTPSTPPTATPPPGEATAAPPPTGSQPGGTPAGGTWHTVQAGETLASIARKYGTTWQAIAQANNLPAPYTIYVGQKLK
ncbi:MAG TPA: LysM domain-containing protein, partial [Chloroflexi bacterium]|nr:LysM domain-containing protein [Chloroflexota bacterium]